jgi:hypothetical protein
MDLERFRGWLDAYFAAWVSNDPDDVRKLFAEDAVYWWGPFREPAEGREAIVAAWVDGPPQAQVEWSHEPFAVVGNRGMAHWRVSCGDQGDRTEMDGILAIDFDENNRCVEHREWFDKRTN